MTLLIHCRLIPDDQFAISEEFAFYRMRLMLQAAYFFLDRSKESLNHECAVRPSPDMVSDIPLDTTARAIFAAV